MKRFITAFLVLAIIISPLVAFAAKAKVTVSVDGLSCPFCAYGLEKKLKKMEEVEGFNIDLEGGKVDIFFSDIALVQKDKVEQVVKESGFTPRKIKIKEIE